MAVRTCLPHVFITCNLVHLDQQMFVHLQALVQSTVVLLFRQQDYAFVQGSVSSPNNWLDLHYMVQLTKFRFFLFFSHVALIKTDLQLMTIKNPVTPSIRILWKSLVESKNSRYSIVTVLRRSNHSDGKESRRSWRECPTYTYPLPPSLAI